MAACPTPFRPPSRRQEENEKIKRQIVWAHVLRTVYFIVAYEDDTVQYSSVEATDRPVSLSLQCLCSLAPRNQCFCIYIFSARGEHWGQTLSECACELSQPVPSLPLPATKCCLYVSLKLAPLTQNAITRRVFSRKSLPTSRRRWETTLSTSLFNRNL